MNYGKIGATMFALWGILHILGGAMILMAVGDSPDGRLRDLPGVFGRLILSWQVVCWATWLIALSGLRSS